MLKMKKEKGKVFLFVFVLLTMILICRGGTALASEEKPIPADNYYSWYSYDIADNVINYIINGEYHPHVDFNGDNELTMCDVVSIIKRYEYNVKYGNTITLDEKYIEDVAEENGLNIIYWEIYKVNDELCREYEYTADNITTVYVWYEEEEKGDSLVIELNPFEEIMRVKN
jgi:hypothetical protein